MYRVTEYFFSKVEIRGRLPLRLRRIATHGFLFYLFLFIKNGRGRRLDDPFGSKDTKKPSPEGEGGTNLGE